MNPQKRFRQILSMILTTVMLFSLAAFAQAQQMVFVPDYGEITYEAAHALFPDDYPIDTPVDTTPVDTGHYRPSPDLSGIRIPIYQIEPDVQPILPPVWGEGLTKYVEDALTALDETEAGDDITIRADKSGMTTVSRTLLEKFEERGDVDLVCVYDRFGETMQFTIPAGTSVTEHIGNASFVEFHNLADRLGITPVPATPDNEKGTNVNDLVLREDADGTNTFYTVDNSGDEVDPGSIKWVTWIGGDDDTSLLSAIPYSVQPSENTVLSGLPVGKNVNVIQLQPDEDGTFVKKYDTMSEADQAQAVIKLQDQQAAYNRYLQSADVQIDKDKKKIGEVISSIGDPDTDARSVAFFPSASDPVNAVDMLIAVQQTDHPADYTFTTFSYDLSGNPSLSRLPLRGESKISVTPGATFEVNKANNNNVYTLTLPNNTVNALVEEGYTGEGLSQEETMDAIDSLLNNLASGNTLTQQPDQDVSILMVFEKEEEKVKFEESAGQPEDVTDTSAAQPTKSSVDDEPAAEKPASSVVWLYGERTADLTELLSLDKMLFNNDPTIKFSENASEALQNNPEAADEIMAAILAIDNSNNAESEYSFDLGNGESVTFTYGGIRELLKRARERVIYKDEEERKGVDEALIKELLEWDNNPTYTAYTQESTSITIIFTPNTGRSQFEEKNDYEPEIDYFNTDD